MIKIVTTKEELLSFKNDWNDIYNSMDAATPFQKFEFVASVIDMLPTAENLYFIFVREVQRKQWIAIFPFVKTHDGILRFVSERDVDFCQPLVRDDANNFNLYDELSKLIKETKEVKGLQLMNLPAYSPMNSVLKTHFKYQVVYDVNYYPIVKIVTRNDDRDSIDCFRDVQATKRKNLRKQLKQANSESEFILMSKAAGNEYPESHIKELVNDMIDKGIRSYDYFSESMLKLWRDLYNYGVLSVAMVLTNGNPSGCQLVFYDEKRNEYITWILLYKDSSWNMKSCLMLAEYLYNNGGATINFARGIYDYKLVNFHPDVKPLFCLKIAKTKWGHFKNVMSMTYHYSKPIVKAWLRR